MLVILLGWIKSQAQESKCLTQNQIHNVNEYRLGCEKCKLDLTDTVLALKDARKTTSTDHSVTVVIGVVAFLFGVIIGPALK